MNLHKLTLTNFQGIKHFEYDFGGKNACVYGDNATGKTTLFNAITWLLFGTSSTGAKSFSPKTVGPNGELHGLEHSVEAVMGYENEQVPFKKVFSEIWRTKRGSVDKEFSGHTIEYFVNGVPVQEKEFMSRLPASPEIMKLIVIPWYFSEGLSWQDRRKILIEMGGEVSDDDVIKTPGLEKLPLLIADYATANKLSKLTVDEYKKIATEKRKLLNKRLDELPGRIDEATLALPDLSNMDEKLIKVSIDAEKAKLDELQRERSVLINSGTSNLRAEKILQINTKAREKRVSLLAEMDKAVASAKSDFRTLERNVFNLESVIRNINREIENLTHSAITMEKERDALVDEFTKISNSEFDGKKTICPCCNRPYDPEKIAQAKADFNINKSKRLEDIQEKGKRTCSAAMILELNQKIDKTKTELEQAQVDLDTLKADMKKASDEVDNVRKIFEDALNLLEEEREDAVALVGMEPAIVNATDAIDEEVAKVENVLRDLNRRLSLFDVAQIQTKRIDQLNEERKLVAKEFEELDLGLRLVEIFIKSKMDMLSEKVNGMFKSVSFRLFVEQINGGIKEDCEVLVPGPNGQMVSFAHANNAARINSGLEIIGVLQKHYNNVMTVFVDNAEAVTKLADPGCQLIQLIVSEADKKLRITQ